MVIEGVCEDFTEHKPIFEQPNNAIETEQLRQQVKDMQQMIEQMNVVQQNATQQQQQLAPSQKLFY